MSSDQGNKKTGSKKPKRRGTRVFTNSNFQGNLPTKPVVKVSDLTAQQIEAAAKLYTRQQDENKQKAVKLVKSEEAEADKQMLERYRGRGAMYGTIGNAHLVLKNSGDISKNVEQINTAWTIEGGRVVTYTKMLICLKQPGVKAEMYTGNPTPVAQATEMPQCTPGSGQILRVALKTLNSEKEVKGDFTGAELAKKFIELRDEQHSRMTKT